jgi:hypothetical protein
LGAVDEIEAAKIRERNLGRGVLLHMRYNSNTLQMFEMNSVEYTEIDEGCQYISRWVCHFSISKVGCLVAREVLDCQIETASEKNNVKSGYGDWDNDVIQYQLKAVQVLLALGREFEVGYIKP